MALSFCVNIDTMTSAGSGYWFQIQVHDEELSRKFSGAYRVEPCPP